MISTISNEGSVHFMTYKETMTAALFITFLERLLGETTRKVFLIVDRLKAHDAKKVEAWTADHRDRIELFFLSRHAPERNPDEYLNNNLKEGISTRLGGGRFHPASYESRGLGAQACSGSNCWSLIMAAPTPS